MNVVSLVIVRSVVYVDVICTVSLAVIVCIAWIVIVCAGIGGFVIKPTANPKIATAIIAIKAPLEIPFNMAIIPHTS